MWDGTDGSASPTFVQDGIYNVSMYIQDSNGVQGVTKATEISVISLRYDIGNIRMSPSGPERPAAHQRRHLDHVEL